ncbi:MAG TPA: protease inhibitor I9 family protein, partial [Micromonosporaceae bacterium]|nr:protease inhibitor I9 family protein [Micromonosporaceae bacterium]
MIASISSATAQDAVHSTAASAGGPTRNVIVVLRNQHTDLSITKGRAASARVNAYRSDQAPVMDRARADGVRNLHGYSVVNGFSATVTATQADQLAADPSVAAVYPDLTVKGAPILQEPTGAGVKPDANPTNAICPSDPNHPLLEPEALGLTNDAFEDPSTPSAQQIVDGTGVKVAWIADGIDINNPDFIRPDNSHVFIDYQDFS